MLICVTDHFDTARLISCSFPDYLIHFDHKYILKYVSIKLYWFANSPVCLGGSILVFYIFDYTSQILYGKSRRFGTYSSAFFSAMTKNRQELVYKK